ncbi:MAG: hypothetical protein R3C16_08370 [Hyphomonadaceae bacterium]
MLINDLRAMARTLSPCERSSEAAGGEARVASVGSVTDAAFVQSAVDDTVKSVGPA